MWSWEDGCIKSFELRRGEKIMVRLAGVACVKGYVLRPDVGGGGCRVWEGRFGYVLGVCGKERTGGSWRGV